MLGMNNTWKSVGVLSLLGILIVILLSRGLHFGSGLAAPAAANAITIGFIAPLSGDVAMYGENEKKGLDLAVEQINTAGGIGGRPIRVVVEDTQCDPKAAVSAVQKLVEIEGVLAIIGDTCSSAVLATKPMLDASRVPAITPTAGADSISGASPYLFRNFIANRQYAEYGANLLLNVLHAKRVGMLYIDNDMGKNMSADFSSAYRGDIVYRAGYSPSEKDFRTVLMKLATAKPDIVYLAGYYQDGALIVRQAKELGLTLRYFGAGDGYDDPEFIALAGAPTVEDFTYLSVPIANGPAAAAFRAAFSAKYHVEPPIYSDGTYDTMQIISAAIRDALSGGQLTSGRVAEKLRTVEFAGASNVVKFDGGGDLINPAIVVKRISNGAASIVQL